MAIHAIALLSIADLQLPADKSLRVQRLDDAVLLHTGLDFGAEPEDLARSVRAVVGDAIAQHTDPRGIFLIPSVAAPRARSYAEVIAEVGEGGMWGAPGDASAASGFGMPEGLESALGSMLGQLPSGLLDSLTQAAARGDMGALQQASMGLEKLLQSNPQLAGLASELEQKALQAGFVAPTLQSVTGAQLPAGKGDSAHQDDPTEDDAPDAEAMLARLGIDTQSPALAAMLGGGGVDVDSPAFAQMMAQVQAQLANDPGLLMSLAAQLMGGAAGQDGQDPHAEDGDDDAKTKS